MNIDVYSLHLQHAYRDGRLEEVVLRHLGNEDGQTVISKHIRFYALPFHLSPIFHFLLPEHIIVYISSINQNFGYSQAVRFSK